MASKIYYTKLSDIDQVKFINECIKKGITVNEETIQIPIDRDYPLMCAEIDDDEYLDIFLADGPNSRDIKLSPTKFKQFVRNYKPITVKLNKEYTAILKEDHVKVGCQKIPYSAIKELVKAMNKMKK